MFKKTWQEGSFYHVRRVQMFVSNFLAGIHLFVDFYIQNGRYGRFWGLKYENGELVSNKFEKIPGVL